MAEQPSLADKMRRLAATGHAEAAMLRQRADEIESAARGFYAEPQTVSVQKFVGCWARARRLWCDCTGEPLVGGIGPSPAG